MAVSAYERLSKSQLESQEGAVEFFTESEPCVKLAIPKGRFGHLKTSHWLRTLGLVFVSNIVVIAVMVTVYFTLQKADSPEVPSVALTIVSRVEWNADPPLKAPIHLTLPVPFVVIGYTETEFCKTNPECSLRIRQVQKQNMQANLFDIGYNFLIGGDGLAYEGRGWDIVGAYPPSLNTSIGISFIGNFSAVVPLDSQFLAARQLIALGIKEGKIATDYKLFGLR